MSFSAKVVAWHRRDGRRGLPWQGIRDPYRIWLSEIMLQQTQVAAVIPYYLRFLRRFPDVRSLASAAEDEVLQLWSGLGYYARGRNLHAAAKVIAARGFPRSAEEMQSLPGIGRSTAAAIAAFAFGERAAILDGNVKRVLSRVFGLTGEKELWRKAEALLPSGDIEAYTQGLMDLGATLCARRNPACPRCPVAAACVARKQGRIDQLPPPRARKPLPLRRATWFVYRCGGKVLLERRPRSGLWGGLWTFPETRLFDCRTATRLPPIEHGFTHFRLIARPVLCELKQPKKMGSDPIYCWTALASASRRAVPAPVRTLLERLQAAR